MGVPGPVRVRNSFCSCVSMAFSFFPDSRAVDIDLAAEREQLGQLARALYLVHVPQELGKFRCALCTSDTYRAPVEHGQGKERARTSCRSLVQSAQRNL